MKINELKDLLAEIAEKDLSDKSDINDHPCSVAIRAIDMLVEDVNVLKRVNVLKKVNGGRIGQSKRVRVLLESNYNPII